MVFHFGAAGCAQQAGAGNPPTAVSIAENASTGENNAFKALDGDPDIFTVDYSDWGGSTSESFGTQYAKDISVNDLGDFEDTGVINIDTYAYLRATGATSFSWSGSVYDDDFGTGSGDSTASVTGAGSGGQDSTSTGCGIRFRITAGTGKGGGPQFPTDGEYVIFKLTGTATNSDGSTSADLYLRYDFTS
tara:strand:- start:45 stop:614 length:570 start_codon:yes stop_codon:yes gene_type:complete